MNRWILNMVRMIVDHPDDVRLSELRGNTTRVFEVRCNRGDLGKVIGKDGKTISAMRTLLGVLAARNGCKTVLEVVE